MFDKHDIRGQIILGVILAVAFIIFVGFVELRAKSRCEARGGTWITMGESSACLGIRDGKVTKI